MTPTIQFAQQRHPAIRTALGTDRVTMHEPPEDRPPIEPPRPTAAALKTQIFAAIAVHLREQGRENWHLVREHPAFAHAIGKESGPTGDRRFWRWVDKVSEEAPADRTRPHEGRRVVEEQQAWSEEMAHAAANRNLPAAPPAAFFMRMGADGMVKVDMLEAVAEIWADLQLAREDAFEGPQGARRVSSAKALTQSAAARTKTIATVVQLQRQIYDIDQLHRRYRAIFEFIIDDLAAYPELQQHFLRLVEKLNSADLATLPNKVDYAAN